MAGDCFFWRQPRATLLSGKHRGTLRFWSHFLGSSQLHQIFPKTWCPKVFKLKPSHEKIEWDNFFLRLTCGTFIFKILGNSLSQQWCYSPIDTVSFLQKSLIVFHFVSMQIYPALLYPFRLINDWSLVFDNSFPTGQAPYFICFICSWECTLKQHLKLY